MAEARHVQGEVALILMPACEESERDEPTAERDVRATAYRRRDMQQPKDRERERERLPRDEEYTVRHGIAGAYRTGWARSDETGDQEHEGKPDADVHRPAKRRSLR